MTTAIKYIGTVYVYVNMSVDKRKERKKEG